MHLDFGEGKAEPHTTGQLEPDSKLMKILGGIGLGAGALVLLIASLMTPGFLASHFGSTGILHEETIRTIQVLRISAVCIGVFIVVFATLNLVCRSKVNRFFDFASRLRETVQTRYFYLPFCFICFSIALIFGFLITQSGPGISTDSTMYINAGESLYHGNGFTSYHTGAPLYPLLIAGFMHLGLAAEQAARTIPILCFALLMFPLFFLSKATNNVYTGYITCLMVVVFTPLLTVTSYAWTEMVYILFSALAILSLVKFAESNGAGTKILCLSGLFIGLAILTRYIGVTLVLVGLILIVVKNKRRLKKMVSQALLLGSISCLPVVPWLYRSTIVSSQLVGYGWEPSKQGLLNNINLTVVAFVYDFFAGRTVKAVVPDFFPDPLAQRLVSISQLSTYVAYILLAIIGVCFTLLVIYVGVHSAKSLQKYLERNYVVISYVCIYLITIITIRSISFAGMASRSTIPIYPFLILAALASVFYAYWQTKRTSLKPALFSIITIFCALFLTFQANNSLSFYQVAKHGLGYNSPFWRDNHGIAWVASNVSDNATVYSDRAVAVQFRLKRPDDSLPYSGNEKKVNDFFEKIRDEENSFIICFKTTETTSCLSNNEIAKMNQEYDALFVVADFPEATIWHVHR